MLTKTQARIMEIFAANIAERFSIKGIIKESTEIQNTVLEEL